MEPHQQRRQTAPHLPQNTVVVMPKASPASHGALLALCWGLGLLRGLFVRELVDEAGGAELDGPLFAGAASPTPTPFPSCAEMGRSHPGDWNVWTTGTPSGRPSGVAQERAS